MRISLLNCTPWALETLLMTKNTRLNINAGSLDEVIHWDDERKTKELRYALTTIKSPFEFIDYIFAIEDVSRAFTHQLVRHRVGTSFAQQSQRTVIMKDFVYVTPEHFIDEYDEESTAGFNLMSTYNDTMDCIKNGYNDMIDLGAKPEDARGVLPTNICTNIIFKVNLRALSGICAERLCVKAQGEFQQVVKLLREEVLKIHPWAEPVLRVHCAQTGVCCFPRVDNCRIKDHVYNPESGLAWDGISVPYNKAEIQAKWEKLEGRLEK